MTAQDDLRALSLVDTHHRFMEDVNPRWFERMGYTALSERTGNKATVGCVLSYPDPCPVDATATMRIVYWLSDLTLSRPKLLVALTKNALAITAEMERVGAAKVWGWVPRNAEHLTSFLDAVVAAGKCVKVDGTGELAGGIFYIAGRLDAAEYMGR